jgi:hypothetical protein
MGLSMAAGLINPWTKPRISEAGIPQEFVRTQNQAMPKSQLMIIGKAE